jgi:Ca-activated chloride channel homolog
MRKNLLATFLLACLAGLLCFGCDSPPPNVAPEVSTTDKAEGSGGAWPFLGSKDQGGKQAENLTAKNYILILDGSGSMNDSECAGGRDKSKIKVAKEAVREWLTTVPADENVGLVSFNDAGWTVASLQSGDRRDFIQAIQKIRAGGYTPLASAIKAAIEMLTQQGQKQLGYGEYTIVVVTDGMDNDRSERLSRWVDAALERTPIQIYTIGFCIGGSHDLNQPGRIAYREAKNPQELRKGLQGVRAESESFDATFGNQ